MADRGSERERERKKRKGETFEHTEKIFSCVNTANVFLPYL